MKKVDKSSSAGTGVDSSTTAHDSSVSQPIAKPRVMRCQYLFRNYFKNNCCFCLQYQNNVLNLCTQSKYTNHETVY